MNSTLSKRDAYRVMFRDYPDVVSVEQMSEMLGICEKSAYRLLHENKIAHNRICFLSGASFHVFQRLKRIRQFFLFLPVGSNRFQDLISTVH